LEFIFDNGFKKWYETSSGLILQAIELTKSVLYSWHKNWLANHSGVHGIIRCMAGTTGSLPMMKTHANRN
jgi:hypothetical protein